MQRRMIAKTKTIISVTPMYEKGAEGLILSNMKPPRRAKIVPPRLPKNQKADTITARILFGRFLKKRAYTAMY